MEELKNSPKIVKDLQFYYLKKLKFRKLAIYKSEKKEVKK